MSHWLARLVVRPSHLRDAQKVHRAVWSLFPDYPNERPRMLFRIEDWHVARTSEQYRGVPVLALSPSRPTRVETDSARLDAVRLFDPKVGAGEYLMFRLFASPSTSAGGDAREKVRGRRRPIESYPERVAWLERKLDGVATVLEVRVGGSRQIRFAKADAKGFHVGCRFDGILRVDDGIGLIVRVKAGIGTAKAYGCGLMTLARLE